MSTATVTFKDNTVGRHKDVPPVRLDIPKVPDPTDPPRKVVKHLTDAVHNTVRRHLLSRDVEVDLTWDRDGNVYGFVYAGFHTVAQFAAQVTP